MPLPLLAIAAVGTVGKVLSSIFGSKAKTKALNQAKQTMGLAYQSAIDTQTPWREAGKKALTEYEKLLYAGPGAITEDPGYKFELEQGTKMINRGSAAEGTLGSGARSKRLMQFGQGLASTRYNDFLARYRSRLGDFTGLMGAGEAADTRTAGLEVGKGSAISGIQTQIGDVKASGYGEIANSLTSGLRDYATYGLAGIDKLKPAYNYGTLSPR